MIYFFSKGSDDIDSVVEYNSHNTKRLSVEEVVKKLDELDYFSKK
jgi:hypothetical protein